MIKLNDLAIGYNGEAILEHIDQEFDDGLIYGILAKSGAGKTTLLKTISGLLHPVHGEVVIDGTTYAENKEVLDSTAPSVYFDMCDIWESLGETVNRKVAMTLFDNQYLLPLASKYSSTSTSTSKPVELTEEQKQEIVNYEALLTKSMTVEFVADTAQFKNPEEAYAIMDEFVSIANTLDGAIIQVEGNINARNYSDSGQALSAERAKAVAKYFIACGIDPNRLITVGNGNTKMVADPGSADAYLNRRTDVFFKIIEE